MFFYYKRKELCAVYIRNLLRKYVNGGFNLKFILWILSLCYLKNVFYYLFGNIFSIFHFTLVWFILAIFYESLFCAKIYASCGNLFYHLHKDIIFKTIYTRSFKTYHYVKLCSVSIELFLNQVSLLTFIVEFEQTS